jgi:hypothetical protein
VIVEKRCEQGRETETELRFIDISVVTRIITMFLDLLLSNQPKLASQSLHEVMVVSDGSPFQRPLNPAALFKAEAN